MAKGKRVTSTLWFIAGVLALLAFGIRFWADRELRWSVGAAALFCLVMGFSAQARAGRSTP